MSVESFDPGAASVAVDEASVTRLLQASQLVGDSEAHDFGLSQLERASMAGLITAPAKEWHEAAQSLSNEQIESLVRFFTLAEEAISGWEAGAKSPVVPLVKVLKARGNYDPALTRWIKANTSNRFLPRGSLMDRL